MEPYSVGFKLGRNCSVAAGGPGTFKNTIGGLSSFRGRGATILRNRHVVGIDPNRIRYGPRVQNGSGPNFARRSLVRLNSSVRRGKRTRTTILQPRPGPRGNFGCLVITNRQQLQSYTLGNLLLRTIIHSLASTRTGQVRHSRGIRHRKLVRVRVTLSLGTSGRRLNALRTITSR